MTKRLISFGLGPSSRALFGTVLLSGFSAVAAGGSVSGRVVTSTGRAPIADAFLYDLRTSDCSPHTYCYSVEGWSRSGGSFRLERLGPGHHSLTVTRPGFAKTKREFDIDGGEEVTLGDIEIFPEAVIAGVVLDAWGNPLYGARVFLSNKTDFPEQYSDEDGRFEFRGVAAGQYSLKAIHDHRYLGQLRGSGKVEWQEYRHEPPKERNSSVAAGERVSGLTLRFGWTEAPAPEHEFGGGSAPLAFVVVDRTTKRPVRKAIVRISRSSDLISHNFLTVLTGEDGSVSFNDMKAGSYRIHVQHDQYVSANLRDEISGDPWQVEATNPPSPNQIIEMDQAGVIDGEILYSNVAGPPPSIGLLRLGTDRQGKKGWIRDSRTLVKVKAGSFTARRLVPGTYRLVVAPSVFPHHPPGQTAVAEDQDIVVRAGQVTKPPAVRVRHEPVYTVRGRVRQKGSLAPIADVDIAIDGIVEHSRDGTFTRNDLVSGVHSMTITRGSPVYQRWTSSFAITDKDLPKIDIMLESPVRVRARIECAACDRVSLLGWGLTLYDDTVRVHGATGADGTADLGQVVPGNYEISAKLPPGTRIADVFLDGASVLNDDRLTISRSGTLNIRLIHPSAEVDGRLKSGSCRAPARCNVFLVPLGSETIRRLWVFGRIAPDGTFRLSNVPAGAYRAVAVRYPDNGVDAAQARIDWWLGAKQGVTIEVRAGSRQNVELDLVTPRNYKQ